ncbi:MAG TPA: hypothetical protein VGM70_01775 [Pseudolysinimonas sp.]|jgi:hypothetical protein
MGFFDDLGKLTQLASESEAQLNVPGRLAQAQQKMDAMTSAMTPPATSPEIEARRVQVSASVVNVSPTSTWVNGQPVVQVDLMVDLPGGMPLPVTRAEVVPQLYLARLVPGAPLPVSLDPATPASLRIEWTRSA